MTRPAPNSDHRSLRERLRADTRIAHERLDRLLAEPALAGAEGLAGFLRAQADALAALSPAIAAAGDPQLAAMTGDLSRRLAADLAQAGAGAPARPAAPGRLCPLALRYVLLGARLGVRAIARRRAAGPRIAYFEAAEPPGAWRGLLAELSRRPATGAEAERAVADARAVFAVFEDAARAALRIPA